MLIPFNTELQVSKFGIVFGEEKVCTRVDHTPTQLWQGSNGKYLGKSLRKFGTTTDLDVFSGPTSTAI